MVVPTEELNMKTYAQNINMEFGERVLRGGVGMIMLETVLLTPALTPPLIAGFAFSALYVVFTAIIGQDPVYALAMIAQSRGDKTKGSVAPYPAPAQPRIVLEYKDAA